MVRIKLTNEMVKRESSMRTHGCLTVCALLMVLITEGCAVPKGAILLYSDETIGSVRNLEEVPSDWDGRIFKIGIGTASLDGEERHWHMMRHSESGVSQATTSEVRP